MPNPSSSMILASTLAATSLRRQRGERQIAGLAGAVLEMDRLLGRQAHEAVEADPFAAHQTDRDHDADRHRDDGQQDQRVAAAIAATATETAAPVTATPAPGPPPPKWPAGERHPLRWPPASKPAPSLRCLGRAGARFPSTMVSAGACATWGAAYCRRRRIGDRPGRRTLRRIRRAPLHRRPHGGRSAMKLVQRLDVRSVARLIAGRLGDRRGRRRAGRGTASPRRSPSPCTTRHPLAARRERHLAPGASARPSG